ncbi:peptidoglycan-binding domain-containing protein [Komagataeibacter nataicola]|nr:peptidoglycan-binding domain-containing protein [Komagataeibacter nataicola]WEQ56433.1 peptidoglycan-binding domain-containing protein [Komagataeibacter nataicola]
MLLWVPAFAAPDYHPGFACPRPDGADVLATALCNDPVMAKAELDLEKVFYAHRGQEGAGAYQAIKAQAVAYDTALRNACAIPAAGTPGAVMPSGAASCYVKVTEQQAVEWAESLSGPYAQEAARNIDLHIALQQKLINAGYSFSPMDKADGLYGDAMRTAIKTWQAAYGDEQTGAISDDEVPHVQKLGISRAVRWANQPPEPSLSSDTSAPPLLRIFQLDMLGIQRPFLEQFTGPAKYVNHYSDKTTTYTYMVKNCELTAYEQGGKIQGYGLKITPSCSVPLTPFIQNSTPTVAELTLGDVSAALNGNARPVSDCLESCGNAADPNIGLMEQGSHAEDYVNIEVYAPVVDEKALNAYANWRDALRKHETEDYILNGKFNCDGKYAAEGLHAMRNVAVKQLFVGWGASGFGQYINGQCGQ